MLWMFSPSITIELPENTEVEIVEEVRFSFASAGEPGPPETAQFGGCLVLPVAKSIFRFVLQRLGPRAPLPADSPILAWCGDEEGKEAVMQHAFQLGSLAHAAYDAVEELGRQRLAKVKLRQSCKRVSDFLNERFCVFKLNVSIEPWETAASAWFPLEMLMRVWRNHAGKLSLHRWQQPFFSGLETLEWRMLLSERETTARELASTLQKVEEMEKEVEDRKIELQIAERRREREKRGAAAPKTLSAGQTSTQGLRMRKLQGYFWPNSAWKRVKGGAPPKEYPQRSMTFRGQVLKGGLLGEPFGQPCGTTAMYGSDSRFVSKETLRCLLPAKETE
ncbi:unnamed protein product [Symbiodinium natans]|uniref:Uncharacterized protein n=1 Tax=Symbiodinium natans TaxID=878477 RepID=A0A812JNS5_9DINO|nr:unnamed protein product [Symbiodinium natans]